MGAILNIGFNVGGVRKLDAPRVLRALRDVGAIVTRWEIRESETELTLVTELEKALLPAEAFTVALDLDQEAIAQHDGESGELYGPGAEAWRPFNEDYFLTLKDIT